MKTERIRTDFTDFIVAYKKADFQEPLNECLEKIKNNEYLLIGCYGKSAYIKVWFLFRVDVFSYCKDLVLIHLMSKETGDLSREFIDEVCIHYAKEYCCNFVRVHTSNEKLYRAMKTIKGYLVTETIFKKEVI